MVSATQAIMYPPLAAMRSMQTVSLIAFSRRRINWAAARP